MTKIPGTFDDAVSFVNNMRRARRILDFAQLSREEAFKSIVEDLDRDAGIEGGGCKDLAFSVIVAAYGSSEGN